VPNPNQFANDKINQFEAMAQVITRWSSVMAIKDGGAICAEGKRPPLQTRFPKRMYFVPNVMCICMQMEEDRI
jgi:hypothetical protein